MVLIDMQVAEGVHELAGLAAQNLRDDAGQECVRSDIEWYAKKDVRRALIELEAHPPLLDIELIHIMANREARTFTRARHRVEKLWVPRRDERIVRGRVFAKFLNRPCEVVYLSPVRGRPASP